ncbi:MAG: hypothetical protein ABJC90_16830 [Roseobacter sp.]
MDEPTARLDVSIPALGLILFADLRYLLNLTGLFVIRDHVVV